MFVAMGLSAVIPVVHGLKRYGIQQMNDRIGLTWLVLQGFLYVLGAGIYAVSAVDRVLGYFRAACLMVLGRHGSLSALSQEDLIFGGARTRSFMYSYCLQRRRIF